MAALFGATTVPTAWPASAAAPLKPLNTADAAGEKCGINALIFTPELKTPGRFREVTPKS